MLGHAVLVDLTLIDPFFNAVSGNEAVDRYVFFLLRAMDSSRSLKNYLLMK